MCFIACDQGKYGLDCKQNCSVDCKDGLCNNVDGSCICIESALCIDSKLLIYFLHVVLPNKSKFIGLTILLTKLNTS